MRQRRAVPGWRTWACLVALALGGAAVVACGSNKGEGSTTAATTAIDHVHGLGVDSADGSLRIATHAGLFAPAADGGYVRVGESEDDFMGFSVNGAGDYLGSGHPAAGGVPPTSG